VYGYVYVYVYVYVCLVVFVYVYAYVYVYVYVSAYVYMMCNTAFSVVLISLCHPEYMKMNDNVCVCVYVRVCG